MNNVGLWRIVESVPRRLQSTVVGAERDLEDWIARDPELLEQGLAIVGRQLRLEAGPLDLLALDPQGRWVLIEIKKERLRRDAVAQALDYASCLCHLDSGWLREKCGAYLRTSGATQTLDQLLEERGQSLDDRPTEREVVIYLVGTGVDPGLDRMVGYLSERSDISLRVLTFLAYRDDAGGVVLAREIHERSADAAQSSGRTTWPIDDVLRMADENGVGEVVQTLFRVASDLGLQPRPNVKSIMFAPPTNRTRCLFVVWITRRKEPGVAKAFIAAEAFEQFYGIPQQELIGAVGQVGYVQLDRSRATSLAAALRQLIGDQSLQG